MSNNRMPDPEIEIFVNKHYEIVCHFFAKMIHNKHEAPVLANQAFLKFIPKFHDSRIRSREDFFWRIAWNTLHDYREWLPLIPPTENSVRDQANILQKEEISYTKLHQALNQLSILLRQVIILRYFKHLSLVQIANLLNTNYKTVQSRHTRALDKLRIFLDLKDFSQSCL